MTLLIASMALAVWLYLLAARGGFWRCRERDDWKAAEPVTWPPVVVVVPARNEADNIAQSIAALLQQDYPGRWRIILVDDDSSDGTGEIARGVAQSAPPGRLQVVSGGALPAGWTGKLWAMKRGIETAHSNSSPASAEEATPPDYLLFTDADIVHDVGSLRRLVEHAESGRLVLTSLMVKLHCESLAERAHIPAFIFFFQMLYPFAWVNQPASSVAAAAGGCMLVRADALGRAGGIDAVRGALIDDCALARLLKVRGPISLTLSERVHSIRDYSTTADIRRLVVRSAYAQLGYSPLLLLATAAGMMLTYVAPPALAIFAHGAARMIGILTWLMMALAFQPTLRLYRVSPLWGIALPAIALQYLLFTLDSAYQYAQGRGGNWKGRAQANVTKTG